MKNTSSKYTILIIVLALAPVARELFFGIVSHHHSPFSSVDAFLHTFSEVLFMLCLGVVLAYLDKKFLTEKSRELKVTQSVAIEALASLAEYRDAETSEHLLRMREFVKILTSALCNEPQYKDYLRAQEHYIEDLANASVLHDIGKIAVPDGILMKPGALTPEEFEVIKTHTSLGSEILTAADSQFRQRLGKQSYLALAQSVARSHHEKWDGSGYPDGLTGEEIPLSARIVAVCDVYDAVTSDRVYKKAWPHAKAVALIKGEAGTHFDPAISQAFLQVEDQFEKIKQEH